jgi:hypothetical protein
MNDIGPVALRPNSEGRQTINRLRANDNAAVLRTAFSGVLADASASFC